MQSPAHPLDLPERRATGIGPWAVAVLAGAGASLASWHLAEAIPADIAQEATRIALDAGEPGIEVRVDGRDVELAGALGPTTDRERLVSRIADIDGARIVLDGLSVVDPEAEAREARAAFGDGLGRIDGAAFAFEPGSVTLSAASEPSLETLLRLLRGYPAFRIRVAGHTDDTGRPDVNLRLSRERAGAVARWLTARGIDAGRIIVQGYGSTQPVADNATAAGRARNRRIEIRHVD